MEVKMSKRQIIELFEKTIKDDKSYDLYEPWSGQDFILEFTLYDIDDITNRSTNQVGKFVLVCEQSYKEDYEFLNGKIKNKSFGCKYFIKFITSDLEGQVFKHELTSEEFSSLVYLYKQKKIQYDKINLLQTHMNFIEERENMKVMLERVSDRYDVNFFPKKRKVLVEKNSKKK